MKDRPRVELAGKEGNVFYVLGMVTNELNQIGLHEEAKELADWVLSTQGQEDALNIISEYVQTERSGRDPGILEDEDITVAPEIVLHDIGAVAVIELHCDITRRFGVELQPDESFHLLACCHPSAEITLVHSVIEKAQGGKRPHSIKKLLPSERRLIRKKVEEAVLAQEGKTLQELYPEQQRSNSKQRNRSKEKNQYER